MLQEHPLRACQTHQIAIFSGKPAPEIDFDVFHPHHSFRVGGHDTPTKHCPHARAEFFRVERLYEVIVGAKLQSPDFVLVSVTGSEKDNRDIGALSYPPHHLESTHVRHDDVEDDHVRSLVLDDGESVLAVACCYHSKALTGKFELDKSKDSRFVVDRD